MYDGKILFEVKHENSKQETLNCVLITHTNLIQKSNTRTGL